MPLDDYAPGTADGPNDQHPPDDHPPPQRQSAFNAMDMDVFRTGVAKILPKDSQGRTVMVTDSSHYKPAHSFPQFRSCKLKWHWYFYHIVAFQNPISQTHGFVLMSIFREAPTTPGLVSFALELIYTALPIRSVVWHVVFPPHHFGPYQHDLADYITHNLLGPQWSHIVRVHQAESTNDLLQQLHVHGLSRRKLPTTIGGDWNAFESWWKRQWNLDQDLFWTAHAKQHDHRSATARRSSQRRREQKAKEQALRQTCMELQTRNATLQATRAQLETLLCRAQTQVALRNGWIPQLQSPALAFETTTVIPGTLGDDEDDDPENEEHSLFWKES